MRGIISALTIAVLLAASPAEASWNLRLRGTITSGGGGGGGYTIAGSGTQPTPVQGPGITTYNDITPINYGSPGAFGYSLPAVARWNDVPLVEVGTTGANGTRHIGVLCSHAPTDTELAAGTGDNVTDVLVRVDGGGWYKITARTTNPDAGNYSDFNFVINSQNFTDGRHRVDAICETATGPATILEGPLEVASAYWTLASTGASNNATINNGSTLAGHILTAPTGTYGFQYGWSVEGIGVAANTFVDGDANTNPTACAAETGSNCTGNLGAGTYHVTGAAQLVAAGPMTGGDFKSFYFVTDYNGTLNRGTHIIYLCGGTCGSVTGSDSNSGATALLPVATTKAARGKIYTNAGTTGGGAFGAYGGIVCVMGGLTYASDSGVGNDPADTNGWLKYVSADMAPCSVAGDPGSPVMHFDGSNRTYGSLRVWYKGIVADGAPNTLNASVPDQLVAEQSKIVGLALNEDVSNNSAFGQGGFALLESNAYIFKTSANAYLARNSTLSYGSEDGFHGPPVVIGNTTVGIGPNWNFGMQGTAVSGQNTIVVSGLPTLPGIPAALQKLSRWFYVGSTNTNGISMANGCFDGATVTAVNDATSTLTMSTTATCSGTSAMAWAYASQPHGDNIQFQSGSQANDVIIADNTFNNLYPSDQQGLFIETVRMSGAYIARNYFSNSGTVESIINVNGGNDNFTLDRNQFQKDTAGSGYRLDYQAASTNETLNQNTCTGVGTGTFAGSAPANRQKAAVSNSCQ